MRPVILLAANYFGKRKEKKQREGTGGTFTFCRFYGIQTLNYIENKNDEAIMRELNNVIM